MHYNNSEIILARCVVATYKTGTIYAQPITSRTLTYEIIDGIAANLASKGHASSIRGYDRRAVKHAILMHEHEAKRAYDSTLAETANDYSAAYRAYTEALESEIS